MEAATHQRHATSDGPAQAPDGTGLLRAILAFAILSTAVHYTHNFIEVHRYPGPHGAFDTFTRALIVISWPLLTAIGLAGYRRYREGRYEVARIALAVYSVAGLITPAHFVFGEPQIPAFFYATLFTDALAGLAVLAFALRLPRGSTARSAPRLAETGR